MSKEEDNKEGNTIAATKPSYARLLGEFIGTLDGVLAWDIPHELAAKLEKKIVDLKKIEI